MGIKSRMGMGKTVKNILLVEDHLDTAMALRRLLELSGYRVGTADTVQSALRLCEAQRFDLLISDIGLPDGTGHELMRELAHRYGAKGICLTGYGMEQDLELSRQAGFIEHLVKPISIESLQAAIERAAQTETVHATAKSCEACAQEN
jgi:CheY-like chemotaxis protein